MGSTDRWYRRTHPWRWARHFWPHWLLAFALMLNAVAVSGPIFARVGAYQLWPPAMAGTALLVVASAFVPDSHRLQATTAAALAAVGAFRIVVYLQLVVFAAVPSSYFALVGSLVAHWIVTGGVVAPLWPWITEECDLRATTAAGRLRSIEGRGAGGVA